MPREQAVAASHGEIPAAILAPIAAGSFPLLLRVRAAAGIDFGGTRTIWTPRLAIGPSCPDEHLLRLGLGHVADHVVCEEFGDDEQLRLLFERMEINVSVYY